LAQGAAFSHQPAACVSRRLTRWTVPTPSPTTLATLPMPIPLASSRRASSILSGAHDGPPRRGLPTQIRKGCNLDLQPLPITCSA
jgi:hypothetical protein